MRAVASMADPRSGRYLIQPRAMTIRDILVARQKLMTLTARPTKSRKIGRNETNAVTILVMRERPMNITSQPTPRSIHVSKLLNECSASKISCQTIKVKTMKTTDFYHFPPLFYLHCTVTPVHCQPVFDSRPNEWMIV